MDPTLHTLKSPFDAPLVVGDELEVRVVNNGCQYVNCADVSMVGCSFVNIASASENDGGRTSNPTVRFSAFAVSIPEIARYGFGWFGMSREHFYWGCSYGKLMPAEGCMRLGSQALTNGGAIGATLNWCKFTSAGADAGLRAGWVFTTVFGCLFDGEGCGAGAEVTDADVLGPYVYRIACNLWQNTADRPMGGIDGVHNLHFVTVANAILDAPQVSVNGPRGWADGSWKGPGRGMRIRHMLLRAGRLPTMVRVHGQAGSAWTARSPDALDWSNSVCIATDNTAKSYFIYHEELPPRVLARAVGNVFFESSAQNYRLAGDSKSFSDFNSYAPQSDNIQEDLVTDASVNWVLSGGTGFQSIGAVELDVYRDARLHLRDIEASEWYAGVIGAETWGGESVPCWQLSEVPVLNPGEIKVGWEHDRSDVLMKLSVKKMFREAGKIGRNL